mmetsp:Transcript_120924/g.342016  ORF Transcript_120924/g.342016 Transcript_120924/m.342016 type:complete len:228 (+) Transcript_120924:1007-1690(+)
MLLLRSLGTAASVLPAAGDVAVHRRSRALPPVLVSLVVLSLPQLVFFALFRLFWPVFDRLVPGVRAERARTAAAQRRQSRRGHQRARQVRRNLGPVRCRRLLNRRSDKDLLATICEDPAKLDADERPRPRRKQRRGPYGVNAALLRGHNHIRRQRKLGALRGPSKRLAWLGFCHVAHIGGSASRSCSLGAGVYGPLHPRLFNRRLVPRSAAHERLHRPQADDGVQLR